MGKSLRSSFEQWGALTQILCTPVLWDFHLATVEEMDANMYARTPGWLEELWNLRVLLSREESQKPVSYSCMKKILVSIKGTEDYYLEIIEHCGKVEGIEIMTKRCRWGKKSSAFINFDDQEQSVRLSFGKMIL